MNHYLPTDEWSVPGNGVEVHSTYPHVIRLYLNDQPVILNLKHYAFYTESSVVHTEHSSRVVPYLPYPVLQQPVVLQGDFLDMEISSYEWERDGFILGTAYDVVPIGEDTRVLHAYYNLSTGVVVASYEDMGTQIRLKRSVPNHLYRYYLFTLLDELKSLILQIRPQHASAVTILQKQLLGEEEYDTSEIFRLPAAA